jgi:hypothetical protein
MTTPTCQTCRHFAVLKNQCRAMPPKVFLAGANQQGQPMMVTAFPTVSKDDRCGHHVPDAQLRLDS